MEMTLEKVKAIIGDQHCQIITLIEENNQLKAAYNKLLDKNKESKPKGDKQE